MYKDMEFVSEPKINEECMELKNIKYKTMLITGTQLKETKPTNDFSNFDKFLENDKINSKNEPWSKLDKTIKTKKLLDFVEEYREKNNLDAEESILLINFFKDCLDRKKLQRVKDVSYDKENGIIKDIPALSYTKSTKHFTLKNMEKRVSTIKSLPPKKSQGTIKNKTTIECKTDKTIENSSEEEY
jgi:hypothetical protein